MATNRIDVVSENAIDLVGIAKGDERYMVLMRATVESRREALRRVGAWASDPRLNFNWDDAAAMSVKICELGQYDTGAPL